MPLEFTLLWGVAIDANQVKKLKVSMVLASSYQG
jgi:hypothetical protein